EPVHREEHQEGEGVARPRDGRSEDPAGEGPLADRAAERARGPEGPEEEPRDLAHRLPSQRWIVSMKALGYSGGIADASSRRASTSSGYRRIGRRQRVIELRLGVTSPAGHAEGHRSETELRDAEPAAAEG